jgi:hypothetical protein
LLLLLDCALYRLHPVHPGVKDRGEPLSSSALTPVVIADFRHEFVRIKPVNGQNNVTKIRLSGQLSK